MSAKPTAIYFEVWYDDKSGVEFGVSCDKQRESEEIRFHHIDHASFPIERLDWLIQCLEKIRAEIVTE
ncbi:hypothetical protein SAMN05660489_04345 [Pseudomonas sp. LAMO17WK12:I10]|uniref:hypothetical protein n=1 Tax=unclassified Pseudomonas TaxID=196821 RepID=UPI000BDA279E|nr:MULTISPECIES: hypothetical protein [unclassified Pseudomonas]PXX60730.1 hypothetical protein H160_04406 [Pseudomonas sp. LAMO17WK12:I9]SNY45340.1 hypothetical protein SAMN05660489_04345 [Pseudomonas sp. LAMO17WK12:I10]